MLRDYFSKMIGFPPQNNQGLAEASWKIGRAVIAWLACGLFAASAWAHPPDVYTSTYINSAGVPVRYEGVCGGRAHVLFVLIPDVRAGDVVQVSANFVLSVWPYGRDTFTNVRLTLWLDGDRVHPCRKRGLWMGEDLSAADPYRAVDMTRTWQIERDAGDVYALAIVVAGSFDVGLARAAKRHISVPAADGGYEITATRWRAE